MFMRHIRLRACQLSRLLRGVMAVGCSSSRHEQRAGAWIAGESIQRTPSKGARDSRATASLSTRKSEDPELSAPSSSGWAL